MTSTRLGITLGLAAGVVVAMAPGARAQLACGGIVPKGQTVTLTADLGPCDGGSSDSAVQDGFYVASTSPKNRLTGNTVVSNGDDGFECRGAKNKIEGNTANNNAEDGIDLPDALKNKVTGNTATGNLDDGFDVGGTKNKILGNTATANGQYGIVATDRKNKVIGNTATGNIVADIVGECANKFKDNTFGTGSSCVK